MRIGASLLVMAFALGLSGPALGGEGPSALLAVDAASGEVLAAHSAGRPHHPASLTKLMTAYVAFRAVASGRVALTDRVVVSDRAAGQGGSLLGLSRGETLSLDSAIRGMIVRSGNDAAVAVAEHVAGSEAAFAAVMSAEAARLGMTASHFANASGMTAPGHVTTARDMAVLALALDREFPGYRNFFSAREVRHHGRGLPTVNGFLVNFSGAEGMKTGFTCPAGYNVVALAGRGGRRVVTVVLGAESLPTRLGIAMRTTEAALKAQPLGQDLARLPNGDGVPPDHSLAACGFRSGGEGGRLGQGVVVPGGWALEVSFGIDPVKVRKDAGRVLGQLQGRLGGGAVRLVARPRDGLVRWRGLLVGLTEQRAIATCLEERRSRGEERCTVLTPMMLKGALEDERRFRMIQAR